MSADFTSVAVEAAETVSDASHGRALAKAVRRFVGLLRDVPDGLPSDFAPGAIALLGQLSERVIVKIEQRLAEKDDRASIRQELAGAIYAIRDALEEIDRWQLHFARRRPGTLSASAPGDARD